MKKEKISIVAAVSFFLLLFLSLKPLWKGEKIRGGPGPGYEYSTQPHDG
jgi:hypothetical protein